MWNTRCCARRRRLTPAFFGQIVERHWKRKRLWKSSTVESGKTQPEGTRGCYQKNILCLVKMKAKRRLREKSQFSRSRLLHLLFLRDQRRVRPPPRDPPPETDTGGFRRMGYPRQLVGGPSATLPSPPRSPAEGPGDVVVPESAGEADHVEHSVADPDLREGAPEVLQGEHRQCAANDGVQGERPVRLLALHHALHREDEAVDDLQDAADNRRSNRRVTHCLD